MRMALTADRTDTGATVTGMHDLPGWSVTVTFATNAVTLTPPPGEHVDAVSWRRVNIGQVLRAADALRRGDVIQLLLSALASDGGDDPSASSRGGRQAHLKRVAGVYRLALEHDIPPQEALSEHFGAERRTTQRWITDARKAGLIRSYREELARVETFEGTDGQTHPTPTHHTHGEPPTQAELDRLADLLNSPEHQKRRGRVPGKGSTTGRKTES